MRKLYDWFTRWFTGKPHEYIGGEDNPYMLRWFILPRNPWLRIYLHKFVRDDDDRALHDHPWSFISIMLWGSYKETLAVETSGGNFYTDLIVEKVRRFGSITYRPATARHKISLEKVFVGDLERSYCKPCWTLVFTGFRKRNWGFWCPQGFVPWREFDEKGCGD